MRGGSVAVGCWSEGEDSVLAVPVGGDWLMTVSSYAAVSFFPTGFGGYRTFGGWSHGIFLFYEDRREA